MSMNMFWIAELVALAVGAFWVGLLMQRQDRQAEQRLEQVVAGHLVATSMELQAPFVQRVLQPMLQQLLRRLGGLSPSGNIDKLRRELLIAGSPYGLDALDFLGLRILVATLGTIGLTVILASVTKSLVQSLLAGAVGAIFFSELPNFWLRGLTKRRRKAVYLALPDALDMLTVCIDAGLGLESAFMRIGQSWDHDLAREFRRAVMEMGVGVSWREAMRNLVYRTDVPELSSLVAVLLQADQLGFSISDTLHAQADQLRTRRRQKAQEVARAAPLKMLFPMVIFIMPATFAVILGPAIPMIMESFGQ